MKQIVVFLVIFALAGCAGGPDPGGNRERGAESGRAASDQALAGMDAAFAGTALPAAPVPAENAAAAPEVSTQPVAAARGGREPAWVSNAYASLNRTDYFAAAGNGPARAAAEHDALARLTGLFGQNIQAELRTVSSYNEAVSNGKVRLSENASLENAVRTATELDTLIGAEIYAVWDSGRGAVYALAVMEKQKARRLYGDLIQANLHLINGLTQLSPEDRATFDGYAKYRLAGTIADTNQIYGRVLALAGGGGVDTAALKKGDAYREEAADIARSIPIAVRVPDDRGGRVGAAFTGALSRAGFRAGGNGRYVLQVDLSLASAEFSGNQNQFCRYTVNANLVDTRNNAVIYPYSVTGREGHLTISEAENRAIRAIEQKIAGEYETGLREYLERSR
ncbi:MAG: LPP20 family lipoprotein [Spirochaetaceae bacterium]|nr:LPP20 family lipoprotein [Spirochaetaceae bacterium]